MTRQLYFLAGRGARLTGRLGTELSQRGFEVDGRSLHDGFEALSFAQQVECIRADLLKHHWHADSKIVAHSYGGHLCLSALMGLPPYAGTLALVSPAFQSVRNGFQYYRVPAAKNLLESIKNGSFPKPIGAVGIVSGRDDWQVPVDGLNAFATHLGTTVRWADRGHDLGAKPVQELLDELGIKSD